ncbi:MAG: hypothetical protein NTX71_04355 [Candidatus Aureabacteria bacterium]|nr:hypothetical protein [Candidatus Auribacterota bacterium]
MRKIALYLLLLISLLLPSGCAELKTTAQTMNTMLIELFRLPVYLMKIPFQLMQSLGPMLKAGMSTAANMAPLLMFIERQVPHDAFYADASFPDELERSVEKSLTREVALPLLPLLGRETLACAPGRFILVDARLMGCPRARRALLGSLGRDGTQVQCVAVDASDIFSQRERFLQICRRMRARGDSLFALTAFNDELEALTGTASGDLPPDPEDRRFILRWKRLMEEMDADARRKG